MENQNRTAQAESEQVQESRPVFRTEKEVLGYIEEISRLGSCYGLEGIRELLGRLGDPQEGLSFIHIAGTNGKGSVLAYLSTILAEAGYRTGRYSSPAVFAYRERMQVNGRQIPVKALCGQMTLVKEAAEGMKKEGLPCPTAFEQETAAAFLWFLQKKCDVVVLETGMGGALDATNVIRNTQAAVLTSVSMDHMALLGKTLPEIAEQKAGILKPGCIAVSTVQCQEVKRVLAHHCMEQGAELRFVQETRAAGNRYGITKQSFIHKKHGRLEITLPGVHQIENASLAVEVIDALCERGFRVPEEALKQGLFKTVWPGRFSVVDKKPYFIIDGAHNEDAAKKLGESIRFYFTNKKIVYIMGILRDKEAEKIIGSTCSLAEHIITVTPDHPRAMQAYELAQLAGGFHKSVTASDGVQDAVEMARLLAGRDGVVIAFGSLSYLGECVRVLEHLRQRGNDRR